MNYTSLIRSIDGMDRDWEILEMPTENIITAGVDKKFGKKINHYIYKIQSGQIMPPIIIDNNNNLIDGEHRFHAMELVGKRTVVVIREVGPGTGKVLRDDYFKDKDGEFYLPYEKYGDKDFVLCLRCHSKLEFMPPGSGGNIPEFPDGMPAGPYFYCGSCGLIINKYKFILWH